MMMLALRERLSRLANVARKQQSAAVTTFNHRLWQRIICFSITWSRFRPRRCRGPRIIAWLLRHYMITAVYTIQYDARSLVCLTTSAPEHPLFSALYRRWHGWCISAGHFDHSFDASVHYMPCFWRSTRWPQQCEVAWSNFTNTLVVLGFAYVILEKPFPHSYDCIWESQPVSAETWRKLDSNALAKHAIKQLCTGRDELWKGEIDKL